VTIPYGPEGHQETVTLSTWDFAGQEIYYATHQFFLSERSLYFLVFNLLSPVQSHVEFWYTESINEDDYW
jgi:internalin A